MNVYITMEWPVAVWQINFLLSQTVLYLYDMMKHGFGFWAIFQNSMTQQQKSGNLQCDTSSIKESPS